MLKRHTSLTFPLAFATRYYIHSPDLCIIHFAEQPPRLFTQTSTTIPIYKSNKNKLEWGGGFSPPPHLITANCYNKTSVIDRLSHAETGVLADIDFVEHIFRALVREHQCSENCGQEAERYGDDARVLQLQDRLAESHD